MPKSAIFTRPCLSSSTFSGLMSRCTTPLLVRVLQRLANLRHDGQRLLRRQLLRSAATAAGSCRPRTPSAGSKSPSASPKSWTVTMFGWLSRARAWASRAKRSANFGSAAPFPARESSGPRAGPASAGAPCTPRPCRRGRGIRGFRAAGKCLAISSGLGGGGGTTRVPCGPAFARRFGVGSRAEPEHALGAKPLQGARRHRLPAVWTGGAHILLFTWY